MFSTLHTSARAVLLTALAGGFALVAPTAARAQSVTPEQALLNRPSAAPSVSVAALTQHQADSAPVEQSFIDGERALLNRFPAAGHPLIADPEPREAVFATTGPDGVRALLNRSSL